ncbi:hypothetical protein GOODEAATRI_014649, partial [Goodea atripinnis]
LLSAGGPTYTAVFQTAPRNLPIRTFAAVKAQKKDKQEEAKKEVKKEKKLIDDKDRHKPFGKTAWVPVDDVYVKRFYPRTIHSAADTINMLKRFQELDFTPADQPVYIDLKLDMKLEKKVGDAVKQVVQRLRPKLAKIISCRVALVYLMLSGSVLQGFLKAWCQTSISQTFYTAQFPYRG